MTFAYFNRLTHAQQRVYRKSDAVTAIRLERAGDCDPLVAALSEALQSEEEGRVGRATQALLDALASRLSVSRVEARLLAARPSRSWGELHGLYTTRGRGRPARITVWMRTARHRKVVAFKTFLRTILHELCHHLDYERLKLLDSFHTEGFYKRESSLFHQLMESGLSTPASRSFSRVPAPPISP